MQRTGNVEIRNGVFAFLKFGEESSSSLYGVDPNRVENGNKKEFPVISYADGTQAIVQVLDNCPGHADLELLSGAVDPGESNLDALIREVYEELEELILQAAVEQGIAINRVQEEFERIFTAIILGYEAIEAVNDLFIFQFSFNESSGKWLFRGVFQVFANIVELTNEQFEFLNKYKVLTEIEKAIEDGKAFRPFVHALIFNKQILREINIILGESYAKTNYVN